MPKKTPNTSKVSIGHTPDAERLRLIAEVIETVDNRCLAADGDVTPTLQEMTQEEISKIYALASGKLLIAKRVKKEKARKPEGYPPTPTLDMIHIVQRESHAIGG